MNLLKKIFQQEDLDTGLHSGEAYVLWTQVQARYDTTELVENFLNLAQDKDLKVLIERGLTSLIEPHIKKLEDAMTHYRVPLPPRPPKSVNSVMNTEVFRDEEIFRIILAGSETALMVHVKAVNICTNDSLRNLFMNFVNEELHLFDDLVKYGKLKGWVHPAPAYRI